jgi:hypothetical protein
MVGAQRGETEAPSKAKKYWNLWKQETRLHRFTFYFLFLVGFGLRFAYLFQAVRNDEAYSYLAYSSHSFKTIVTFYNVPNNHIFHNILTHITTTVFGNNIVALRLPVFLCGLAVVPLTYLVIRRVANKNAALLAMALVAISSGLINYSTQARGYMIQTVILLLLVLVGLYLIDTDKIGGWVAFTVLAALGLYTVPTFLYFFPPVMLWVFLSRLLKHYDRKKLLKRSLASLGGIVALTFLLYSPVLVVSGTTALFKGDTRFNGGVTALPMSQFLKEAPKNIRNVWHSFDVGIPWGLAVVILAGLILSVLLYKHLTKAGYNLPLIMTVWIGLMYLGQKQLVYPRTMVPLIPLYVGFASIGLYAVWNLVKEQAKERTSVRLKPVIVYPVLAVLLFVLVWGLVVVAQGPYQLSEIGEIEGSFRQAPAVVSLLKKELKPGDMVIAFPGLGTIPLEYYFKQAGIPTSYLMGTVVQQKGWEKNPVDYMNNNFTGKTRDRIKRALFVVAPKEIQSGNNLISYVTTYMGFDGWNFTPTKTIMDTDWTNVMESERIKTEPLPKAQHIIIPDNQFNAN